MYSRIRTTMTVAAVLVAAACGQDGRAPASPEVEAVFDSTQYLVSARGGTSLASNVLVLPTGSRRTLTPSSRITRSTGVTWSSTNSRVVQVSSVTQRGSNSARAALCSMSPGSCTARNGIMISLHCYTAAAM